MVAEDSTEQRKKAAQKRGLRNFSDTRGVAKKTTWVAGLMPELPAWALQVSKAQVWLLL